MRVQNLRQVQGARGDVEKGRRGAVTDRGRRRCAIASGHGDARANGRDRVLRCCICATGNGDGGHAESRGAYRHDRAHGHHVGEGNAADRVAVGHNGLRRSHGEGLRHVHVGGSVNIRDIGLLGRGHDSSSSIGRVTKKMADRILSKIRQSRENLTKGAGLISKLLGSPSSLSFGESAVSEIESSHVTSAKSAKEL